jgi:ABC-type glycerol-3-phosphate transport system permease component
MTTKTVEASPVVRRTDVVSGSAMSKKSRERIAAILVTLLALAMMAFWLAPFVYMLTTSLKTLEQMQNPRILPESPAQFEFEGKSLDVYSVPMPDGEIRELALSGPAARAASLLTPITRKPGLSPGRAAGGSWIRPTSWISNGRITSRHFRPLSFPACFVTRP